MCCALSVWSDAQCYSYHGVARGVCGGNVLLVNATAALVLRATRVMLHVVLHVAIQ